MLMEKYSGLAFCVRSLEAIAGSISEGVCGETYNIGGQLEKLNLEVVQTSDSWMSCGPVIRLFRTVI